MPSRRDRATVPVAVIAAALLGACQGASFSALSEGRSGSGGGDERRRARPHHEVEQGPTETKVAFAPGQGPRLVFDSTEHDFGEVAQGAKVSHTFKVRNEGKAVLHIKRVRGS